MSLHRLALTVAFVGVALAAAAQQPEAIDRPLRRLQISVRFDDSREAARRDIGASGTLGNRGSRVEVHAEERQVGAGGQIDQRVQVLEGARATIYTGRSRPVRQRQYIQTPAGVVPQEVTVVQETTSGFEVVPRVAGNTVAMEIVSSRAASTVSGRLGEWFELGAVATPSGSRRVWVRVDALGN